MNLAGRVDTRSRHDANTLLRVWCLGEVGELVVAEYSDAASLGLETLGTRTLKR
jgi:hypothetical protein